MQTLSPRRSKKPPPPFVQRCLEFLAPLGPVSARSMFGGHGLYLDGIMFALVAYDHLYLKVDLETEDRFAATDSSPFVYQGKNRPVTMSYWRAPNAAMETGEALLPWAQLAVEASRRAKRSGREPASRMGRAGPAADRP